MLFRCKNKNMLMFTGINNAWYGVYSLCPDDDTFQHLARSYSLNHRKMSTNGCDAGGGQRFSDGITNGAKWYIAFGKSTDQWVSYIILYYKYNDTTCIYCTASV